MPLRSDVVSVRRQRATQLPVPLSRATRLSGYDCADCLAITLEMPFKDPVRNLQPATGWNGARSAQLGEVTVDVLARIVHSLR